MEPVKGQYPEPWEDPKNGSTLGLHNLHYRPIRVQNWGFWFLDSPRALGVGLPDPTQINPSARAC